MRLRARVSIPRRYLLSIAVLVIVAGACTSSSATTTTVAATTTTSAPAPEAVPDTTSTTTTTLDPVLAELLPTDPDVITGVLDNGLRYFIRYNDSPGQRAELRLAVDAGSLFEDDDQAGVAHFLEHMMFNGTERFPRNELIAVLESFGPQFGADINAFTSFDETVYELSLPSDPDLLDLGVEVLREWATEATITALDVIEERGVVLEERRLRDEGLAGRVSEMFQDLLLPGTPYEGRSPIGTEASIESMVPEMLERFYRDWYRPERMAVVAVGDFDVEEMEARIIAGFETVTNPDAPRPAPEGGAPLADAIQAASLADPEVSLTSIQLMWPTPVEAAITVGDRQDEYILIAAMNMLATRLSDDALRGTVPLLSAGNASTGYTRAFALSILSVQARPEETTDALDALNVELARIRAHGFSRQEFARAIAELAASVELSYETRSTNQDVGYAAAIVDHYLTGEPLLSPEQQFKIDTAILARLTRANVEAAFVESLDSAAPRVVVVGPDDETAVPDADQIVALLSTPPASTIEPREDVPELEALMTAPGRLFATDVVTDEDFGFVTITFANGATVMVWPTLIADNLVTVEITSFGGTSLVPVGDVVEAELISEMVGRSGVGPADAATYQLFVADRIVSVTPWISETREGIRATAATEDVEVMMQVIHLLMTAPRADAVAVDAVIAGYEARDATRDDVPDAVIRDELTDAYYSGDPRYFSIPSAADLADFDAARALEIFRERFANAGDFVYAIVGDFDMEQMADLVSRYIATLPGTPEREEYVDHQPLPPREVQLRTVAAGTDPQGEVQMFFTNRLSSSAEGRVTGRLLELIVNARIRERIREEISATYSPRAAVSVQREPDPFIETNITVTGDPERLEEISMEILADLADLAANGPSETEFSTAQQQLRIEMELFNNPQLARALTTSFLYPDQPVSDLVDQFTLVGEVTANDVRRMAGIAYAPTQRIEIRLVPIGF